jgi:hypothetical protein
MDLDRHDQSPKLPEIPGRSPRRCEDAEDPPSAKIGLAGG